jgi:hypothetical protein
MNWTPYGKTWAEFQREEFADGGVVVWERGSPDTTLLGDVNGAGGGCGCCQAFKDSTVIEAYAVVCPGVIAPPDMRDLARKELGLDADPLRRVSPDTVRALLRRIEWRILPDTKRCPECFGAQHEGHKPDCELARLIR